MVSSWRRHRAAGLLAVLILAVPAASSAQSSNTGAVRGRVVDEAGSVQRGVRVRLGDAAAQSYVVETDADGIFRIPFVQPGEYDVLLEKIGYVPKRLAGVAVRPGQELQLDVVIGSLASPVDEAETERFAGGAVAARPGAAQWIPAHVIDRIPVPRLSVTELARTSTVMDETLAAEGLPPHLSAWMVDGVIFRPAAHPLLAGSPFDALTFSLRGTATAEVTTNATDIETQSSAGAQLRGYSVHGTSRFSGAAAGTWTGSALPSTSTFDDSPSHNDINGALSLAGPLLGDSVRFSLGIDARTSENPISAAWLNSDDAAALAQIAEAESLSLDEYTRTGVRGVELLSGFAGLDWSFSGGHRLETNVQFGTRPEFDTVDRRTGGIIRLGASDLVARAALRSPFSDRYANDLTVAVTHSARSTEDAGELPFTLIANEGLGFGTSDDASRTDETVLHIGDAFHVFTGRHSFKIGAGLSFASHSYDLRPRANAGFLFGDLPSLENREGVFRRTEPLRTLADWSSSGVALFAQDRWSPGSGLDVLIGVRLDRARIPDDIVERDPEWFRLTGIGNDVVDQPAFLVSPRIALTWNVRQANRWIARLAGGIYHDRVDPLLLATWQLDDGSARVRRVVGTVNWPTADPAGGSTLPRLTTLGPDFQPPRTLRASGGVSAALSPATQLTLSGSLRRTDRLPRRSDLNLIPSPAGRDQYMRPLYGTLVQHGGLLAELPGSSRRFSTYDEVATVSVDGRSDYWGITASLEHDLEPLSVIARYTFSSTRDDWFDARSRGWTTAPPPSVIDGEDWAEGTSDFDVPHRAVAGVFLNAPFGLRVSALYRLESGLPFTPSFRAGIDANADGVTGNDPAYVDPDLPGMDALLREWPCLQESAGTFAARNSCRGDVVHALDLGLGVRLFSFGRAAAEVSVEALDVIEPRSRRPDAALLLVDPAGTLSTDPVTRITTVPLLVNPSFGAPMPQRHGGRTLRLGLSLKW